MWRHDIVVNAEASMFKKYNANNSAEIVIQYGITRPVELYPTCSGLTHEISVGSHVNVYRPA